MQKVEGSSPFIRLTKAPGNGGFSFAGKETRPGTGIPTVRSSQSEVSTRCSRLPRLRSSVRSWLLVLALLALLFPVIERVTQLTYGMSHD